MGWKSIVGAATGGTMLLGTTLAGGSQYLGYQAQQDEKAAAKVQRRIAALSQARQRREIVRSAATTEAAITASSYATGTQGSSRQAQALGSLAYQAGGALDYSARLQSLGQAASRYLADAAEKRNQAQIIGSITQQGASLFF